MLGEKDDIFVLITYFGRDGNPIVKIPPFIMDIWQAGYRIQLSKCQTFGQLHKKRPEAIFQWVPKFALVYSCFLRRIKYEFVKSVKMNFSPKIICNGRHPAYK